MRKSVSGKIIGIVCFVALASLMLFTAAKVTEKKDARSKYAYFFKEAERIDVLYLGSSHVINAVNPAQIFEEHGYTGYNMGGHGSLMNATYHTLLNALDYCAPKVAFIDVYMMEKDAGKLDLREADAAEDEINVAVEQLHLNMDAFPLTAKKAASLRDLIADQKTRWEFLVPFSVYHHRWKELKDDDWLRLSDRDEKNRIFGAEERYQVFTGTENYAKVPEEEGMVSPGTGVDYLNRTLQLCADNGIRAVLMFLPFYPTEDDQRTEHSARVIAESYGVPYLDFCAEELMEETTFDLRADLNDHGHLNQTGMEKVSAYLGAYLEAHAGEFELEDHRGDPAYDTFSSLSEAWRAGQWYELESAPDDAAKLNILFRNHTPCAVYLRSDASKLHDSGFTYLVDRMANGSGRVYAAAKEGLSYLLICDPELSKPVEILGGEETEGIKTSAGELSFFGSGHYHNLYLDGDASANLLDMEEGFEQEVQIVVLP